MIQIIVLNNGGFAKWPYQKEEHLNPGKTSEGQQLKPIVRQLWPVLTAMNRRGLMPFAGNAVTTGKRMFLKKLKFYCLQQSAKTSGKIPACLFFHRAAV
jgi:hypothetical protein